MQGRASQTKQIEMQKEVNEAESVGRGSDTGSSGSCSKAWFIEGKKRGSMSNKRISARSFIGVTSQNFEGRGSLNSCANSRRIASAGHVTIRIRRREHAAVDHIIVTDWSGKAEKIINR